MMEPLDVTSPGPTSEVELTITTGVIQQITEAIPEEVEPKSTQAKEAMAEEIRVITTPPPEQPITTPPPEQPLPLPLSLRQVQDIGTSSSALARLSMNLPSSSTTPCSSLVVHPSIPISLHGAFGVDDTQAMEYDFHYSSLEGIPMFGDREQEELKLLSEGSISTFRCLITDAPLESINRDQIMKPVFLYEDSSEDPVLLELGTYR
ncbi:uncharacterized protein A4U43_C06F18530 [Asparagus officinalis]|uniref:Uncharacterized protein n=1 Tax=Asparagus officinalis TaxID=4686 RepID=A0A5P1ENP6_ASPOF|nr:uncharacterized protein A4U43_C06F18530 [Asparagus officinalis]